MSPQESQNEIGSLLEALRVSLQEQSPSILAQGSEVANLLTDLDSLNDKMIADRLRWQRKTEEYHYATIGK